uniref:Phosphatidylinositol-glycan biosynthesis class X protein n=1 Tax=Lygus hesperus TaxID=30085 RepID=A0A146M4Y8_LYGHE
MAFYLVVGFFCLFGGCCASVVNDDCPFVFNVERTIKNQGFHRNVDYYFELISVSEMSECHVCVKQAIPLGLYVNKDQITEMVRLGKIEATVDGSVDIEAPADKATPHDVYFHVELTLGFNTMNATVTLPVHTRYHSARKDGGLEEAVLLDPEVLLSCSSIPEQCKNPGVSGEKQYPTTCPVINDRSDYFAVKYATRDKLSEILIPVGNSSHYEIVQLFTFVVTWVGSKFIYYTLLNNRPKDGL